MEEMVALCHYWWVEALCRRLGNTNWVEHEGDAVTNKQAGPQSLVGTAVAAPPLPPLANGDGRLAAGEVIAERFLIESVAGEGGMGAVYRALDRQTGRPVALKVMLSLGGRVERFEQEARLLAELRHPAIVGYVAHGERPGGARYLAMEWLEGETLAARLQRSPLGVGETLALIRRVAEGLAAAHACAIVHRDVKPSNLLLADGDPARAKLIDFGVARLEVGRQAMTRTGAIIGSAGYMAPEQARGVADVDARADVFALGCVLFECLTGEPAFFGNTVVATLAKVVLQEAPRVRALRPELPAALDELVARMLAKDRESRPADAETLLRELSALGDPGGAAPAPRTSDAVTGEERRLYSVVLVRLPADGQTSTVEADRSLLQPGLAGAVTPREQWIEFGGEAVRLADGSLLVAIAARDSATDLAAQAAACALALRAQHPHAPIAVATGRADTGARHPVGPAIDRASALLGGAQSAAIPIDDITADLLDARFEVRRDGDARTLVGRREATTGARTLLGKPTPFVGRDKDLLLLEATMDECVRESVARAVLVTAPAGYGKSRLRYELVSRVGSGGVRALIARADPMAAGSSLGLIRQLVRDATGLREGAPVEEQRARLESYVAGLSDPPDADFLGELLGVPSTDKPGPGLRAARNDPALMAERTRRTFVEWAAAECARGPLLLVLEDLHWGDVPSVTWLAEALKALAERPLLVVALARPEARERFPRFWTQEIILAGLSRRAAEALVRAALGVDLAPAMVARVVERADGNAYYLEELIRRVAEGGSDEFPETVMAMAQSRLERLEPEARRVLRAASVFGETFWDGAATALLGGSGRAEEVAEWLRALAGRELLQARPGGKFPGQAEYVFRHGLMREAAYAMLTDVDRTAAHKLAAGWLEQAGEKDARSIADHLERGGSRERAVPWFLRAAQSALEAENLREAINLAERGVNCGAAGETLGLLRDAQGWALYWSNEPQRAAEREREAVDLLPLGSLDWFKAAGILSIAGMFAGDPSGALEVTGRMAGLREVPRPEGPVAIALNYMALVLLIIGQPDQARGLAGLLERSAALEPDHDPTFTGYLHLMRMQVAETTEDVGAVLREARAGMAVLDAASTNLSRALARNHVSRALVNTACGLDDVARLTEAALAATDQAMELDRGWSSYWRGHAASALNDSPAARALLEPLLASRNPLLLVSACAKLSLVAAADGRLDDAEWLARKVLEAVGMDPMTLYAQAALGRVALARGHAREALELAERGSALQANGCVAHAARALLRLVRVEALLQLGEMEPALAALREARERVLRLAGTIDDPVVREQYLTRVDVNVRTLALAREVLGD